MTTTHSPDLEAIKQTQQQTWASGDFAVVATRTQFVSEHLAESAELRAGWRVLDVATGSGNAAIAAARSGTSVVGVDYALICRICQRPCMPEPTCRVAARG